jgi:hypothetical protein
MIYPEAMATTIDMLKAPGSKLAHEITELVRDAETPLLFHRSSRVYHWALRDPRLRLVRLTPSHSCRLTSGNAPHGVEGAVGSGRAN